MFFKAKLNYLNNNILSLSPFFSFYSSLFTNPENVFWIRIRKALEHGMEPILVRWFGYCYSNKNLYGAQEINNLGETYLIDLPEVLHEYQGLLQPHPLLSQLAQQQLPQPEQ